VTWKIIGAGRNQSQKRLSGKLSIQVQSGDIRAVTVLEGTGFKAADACPELLDRRETGISTSSRRASVTVLDKLGPGVSKEWETLIAAAPIIDKPGHATMFLGERCLAPCFFLNRRKAGLLV
jgi:hypothetical protein